MFNYDKLWFTCVTRPQFFIVITRIGRLNRHSDGLSFGDVMPAIRVDVSKMVARLDDVQRRQVPFAAKNAVNKLAAQAIGNLQDEMRDSFFKPRHKLPTSLPSWLAGKARF